MCLGVEEKVLDVLKSSNSDGAIRFVCCSCRISSVGSSSPSESGALSQLMHVVGAVVGEVRRLKENHHSRGLHIEELHRLM